MKKRLLAALLCLSAVLSFCTAFVAAAGSEKEALGEIGIYNGGYEMAYLSFNGRIREQIYTYYNYVDSNGQTKEIPAYCVNPTQYGVPQTVAEGESIEHIANEKASDPNSQASSPMATPTAA